MYKKEWSHHSSPFLLDNIIPQWMDLWLVLIVMYCNISKMNALLLTEKKINGRQKFKFQHLIIETAFFLFFHDRAGWEDEGDSRFGERDLSFYVIVSSPSIPFLALLMGVSHDIRRPRCLQGSSCVTLTDCEIKEEIHPRGIHGCDHTSYGTRYLEL